VELPDIATRIVLAPMAGGVGTPALVAAVGDAGGFGFLPSGYLGVDRLHQDMEAVRALTHADFGVNVFVPAPPDPARLQRAERYVERLAGWSASHDVPLGRPAYTDDDYPAKLSLLVDLRPRIVSFTFGLPEPEAVSALHDAHSAVTVTVTSPAEALAAADLGVDGLVVQGWEAGAHQGGWLSTPETSTQELWGLLPLLQSVLELVEVPVIAAGGIATGRGVAAVLACGARAAMLGTAFMRCPEAATSPAHAVALADPTSTVMTRAFTGRSARAMDNEFVRTFDDDAPEAYPEVHTATTAMRTEARARGDVDGFHLWAGQAHALARPVPAAELVAALDAEARRALGG
jgi:nitronate monooxygenase